MAIKDTIDLWTWLIYTPRNLLVFKATFSLEFQIIVEEIGPPLRNTVQF